MQIPPKDPSTPLIVSVAAELEEELTRCQEMFLLIQNERTSILQRISKEQWENLYTLERDLPVLIADLHEALAVIYCGLSHYENDTMPLPPTKKITN